MRKLLMQSENHEGTVLRLVYEIQARIGEETDAPTDFQGVVAPVSVSR